MWLLFTGQSLTFIDRHYDFNKPPDQASTMCCSNSQLVHTTVVHLNDAFITEPHLYCEPFGDEGQLRTV